MVVGGWFEGGSVGGWKFVVLFFVFIKVVEVFVFVVIVLVFFKRVEVFVFVVVVLVVFVLVIVSVFFVFFWEILDVWGFFLIIYLDLNSLC